VFDVHKAERRLLDAGASPELAEATADLMSEAVVHNLDALVTRDYLDHVLDARCSEQDARFDRRLYEFESRMLEQMHEIKARFRLMQAMQALLVAGVFLLQAPDVPASRYLRKGCACQYVNERHSHSAGPR
jgi:hypothetical protein